MQVCGRWRAKGSRVQLQVREAKHAWTSRGGWRHGPCLVACLKHEDSGSHCLQARMTWVHTYAHACAWQYASSPQLDTSSHSLSV